jgi:hypothetical protein
MIESHPELEGGIARLDVVLDVRRLLLDGGVRVECELLTAASQIEREETGIEIGVRQERRQAAGVRAQTRV